MFGGVAKDAEVEELIKATPELYEYWDHLHVVSKSPITLQFSEIGGRAEMEEFPPPSSILYPQLEAPPGRAAEVGGEAHDELQQSGVPALPGG